jgi:hypothetical protein
MPANGTASQSGMCVPLVTRLVHFFSTNYPAGFPLVTAKRRKKKFLTATGFTGNVTRSPLWPFRNHRLNRLELTMPVVFR